MIFGAKIVIILETKEYFTYNLVVWRIFIWSFGEFSFGHLALLCLIFGANVPCISAQPVPASCPSTGWKPYNRAFAVEKVCPFRWVVCFDGVVFDVFGLM